MAIDFEREHLVTLTDAAKRFPHRPSLRTIWRWATKGVRGARLETSLSGGRRITSEEAIGRFNSAVNAYSLSAPVSSQEEVGNG